MINRRGASAGKSAGTAHIRATILRPPAFPPGLPLAGKVQNSGMAGLDISKIQESELMQTRGW